MPSQEQQCDQTTTLTTPLPTPMPVATPMPVVAPMETPAPTTPAPVNHQDESSNRNFSEYPLQFDTRTQIIPLKQIIEDSPFFSFDLNKVQENVLQQSNESNQYLPTITVVNSSRATMPSPHSLSFSLSLVQICTTQLRQRWSIKTNEIPRLFSTKPINSARTNHNKSTGPGNKLVRTPILSEELTSTMAMLRETTTVRPTINILKRKHGEDSVRRLLAVSDELIFGTFFSVRWRWAL